MTDKEEITALQIADLLSGLTITGYRSSWRGELPMIFAQELVSRAEDKIRSLQSRVTDLEAEREARHANPADFRYWEGRYRDEKARGAELEAELNGLRDMIQSAEIMTATGDGLDPDETIRLHLMLGAARGEQPVTTERLSKALINANARVSQLEDVCKRCVNPVGLLD